jgi:GT2 family glycosyltransferase
MTFEMKTQEKSLVQENGFKNPPLVSIIIVNYNGRRILGKLLDECLNSVLETEYSNFEAIFVDNGSTDDSVDHVLNEYGHNPKFKVMKLDKNYGWTGGVNKGVEFASGDLLAILNTDVVATPQWLREAVYVLLSNNDVGIVTSKIITDYFTTAGGGIDVLLVGNDRLIGNEELDPSCFHPSGAAFVVKRKIIKTFGELLDPDFFAYFDDVDLGWRCQLLGFDVLSCFTSIVFHKHGGSFGVTSPFKFYLMRKNALDSATKNVSTSNVFKLLPLWLLSTIYAAYLFHQSTGNTTYFFIGVRVILRHLADFRKIWKKHVWMQSIRKVDDEEIFSKFRRVLFADRPDSYMNRLALAFINSWLKITGIKNEIVGFQRYLTFDLIEAHST